MKEGISKWHISQKVTIWLDLKTLADKLISKWEISLNNIPQKIYKRPVGILKVTSIAKHEGNANQNHN